MNSPAEDLFLSLLASGQLDRRRARLLLDGCANQGHITHDEFFATAVATVPDGSRRTYGTGFKRLVTEFGTVSLADVSTSDLDAMCASLLISTRASGRTDGTGAVRDSSRHVAFGMRSPCVKGIDLRTLLQIL